MRSEKVLVLAGGIAQIKLIKELKKRNYYVILADYSERPIAEEYADKFYRESTLDVDAIRRIAIDEKVDYIMTCCTDQAINTMAVVSEELGLPCYLNKEEGKIVTNKLYMKKIFVQNDIPTADFQSIHAYSEYQKMPYPLVVKPADCNSSKGVSRVNNDFELKERINNAIELSRTNSVIIEKFIDGIEISVDLFVLDGKPTVLCVSESEKINAKDKFVIFKGKYPANISKEIYAKIEQTAQKIADAFRIRNGPMIIQTLWDGKNIYVVEFSARTGGCIKYKMIELASGVDVIKATVDIMENKKPVISPKYSKKIIIDEFLYCKTGIFDHVEGIENCIENGLLEEAFVLKKPGARFDSVENSGDRIIALIFVCDSYDDYVEKHDEIIDKIQVIDIDGKDMIRRDLFKKLKV